MPEKKKNTINPITSITVATNRPDFFDGCFIITMKDAQGTEISHKIALDGVRKMAELCEEIAQQCEPAHKVLQ